MMVDSVKPPVSGSPVARSPYNPRSATNEVESISDKERNQPHWNRVDRRQGGDRRQQEGASKHPKFEMRDSTGRRKGDRNTPTIEIKA